VFLSRSGVRHRAEPPSAGPLQHSTGSLASGDGTSRSLTPLRRWPSPEREGTVEHYNLFIDSRAMVAFKVAPYSFSLGVKNHLSQLPTCNLCFPKHSYDTQTPFRGCPGAGVPWCEWQPPTVNSFVHTHVMCSHPSLLVRADYSNPSHDACMFPE